MKTPRSFSAISSQVMSVGNVGSLHHTPPTPNNMIGQAAAFSKGARERFYHQTRRPKNRMNSIGSSISEDPRANYDEIPGNAAGKVSVYNCMKIHTFSKELAERYTADADFYF